MTVLVVLTVGACTTADANLHGSWLVESLATPDFDIVFTIGQEGQPTMHFSDDGTSWTGDSGCNGLVGSYSVSSTKTVTIDVLGGELAACDSSNWRDVDEVLRQMHQIDFDVSYSFFTSDTVRLRSENLDLTLVRPPS